MHTQTRTFLPLRVSFCSGHFIARGGNAGKRGGKKGKEDRDNINQRIRESEQFGYFFRWEKKDEIRHFHCKVALNTYKAKLSHTLLNI